jgi:predicted Abi (CAAX) family protease
MLGIGSHGCATGLQAKCGPKRSGPAVDSQDISQLLLEIGAEVWFFQTRFVGGMGPSLR